VFVRTLRKPDGRALVLYARAPLPDDLEAPAPGPGVVAQPHLRWHPLRGEWVAYASHREDRTFLPPPEYNPLAPPRDLRFPTEVPIGPWDVAVFENRFPALVPTADDAPQSIVETAPGRGACEVVVFTQDARGSLGGLPLDHLEVVFAAWADRTTAIGARDGIVYVMPFENRGVEVGVTLHHPHGQIYAYPFVPPVPARELAEQEAYLAANGRGLLADHVAAELRDGRRVLYAGPAAVAFVPACARYPYEVWVLPIRPVPTLAALEPAERRDLACALQTVLRKYDGLWKRPFPYILLCHQAPTDGGAHPEAHVHFELYPPYRSKERLKYLAGTEIGAGMFANDSLPEAKAAELQAVEAVAS
jgi:UDPglucose--hexose-1-phosphate uridylyltransferase